MARPALVKGVLVSGLALLLSQALSPRSLAARHGDAQATPAPQPGAPTQSLKGAVLKGKAPVNERVLEVKLPRPMEADLPNGIHLIVLEDRRVPIVSFQIQIEGAGGYFDPPDLPGLASFTASLLREGTTSRSSRQISEAIETVAATLNVNAGLSSPSATLFASSLTEHVERVLDLAGDVLLAPTFAADELARYKTQQKAFLVQQRSNPGFLGAEMFSRVMYGEHPAARIAPTPAALETATRERIAAFHQERYAPDFAVIAVAGDISAADARRHVTRVFGGWKKRGAARPAFSEPKAPAARRVHLVERANSVQTNLLVGAMGIDRKSVEYDAFEVMNKVIGGGPSGRLFMNLREDKGYTYGAYSFFSATRHRGAWQASTQVRNDVTEPALKELLAEIDRLQSEPVPEKELAEAKRSLVASFALSLESAESVLGNHITRHIYGLPADYWDTRPARLMAVTREQVQQAARKYLASDRLQIVAVGTASVVGESLKGFGAVTRYDTDGKVLGSSN